MPSVVTERFVECHNHLKEIGAVKSSRQFATMLGFQPQNLSEIVRGKRDAPMELIRKAVDKFRINPMYLYCGEGALLLGDGGSDDLRVLTVVTDAEQNERIVHIPVPAQAGYSQESDEPFFIEQLPCYNLPDRRYSQGSFRSFDVAGDSMEPTLNAGDKVICHFIEPNHWMHTIRDNHVYVVVAKSGLYVKRLVNHLKKHRSFELHSDNEFYRPVRMNISEIKEIWMVSATISDFSHSLPDAKKHSSIVALHETIDEQSALINRLHEKLEKLLVAT